MGDSAPRPVSPSYLSPRHSVIVRADKLQHPGIACRAQAQAVGSEVISRRKSQPSSTMSLTVRESGTAASALNASNACTVCTFRFTSTTRYKAMFMFPASHYSSRCITLVSRPPLSRCPPSANDHRGQVPNSRAPQLDRPDVQIAVSQAFEVAINSLSMTFLCPAAAALATPTPCTITAGGTTARTTSEANRPSIGIGTGGEPRAAQCPSRAVTSRSAGGLGRRHQRCDDGHTPLGVKARKP